MRSSKSRSRSKSSRNRSVGNIVNRVFDSSGPEGKVRGTPQQIIDKYLTMARDAQLSNDRVAAENFQQHAEHYTRMLGEAQREAEARREREESQRRDREEQRAEREAEQSASPGASAPAERDEPQPQPSEDAVANGSADVVDVVGEEADAGLVETPESKPKRRSRSKPKTNPTDSAPDQQQAAE